MTVAPPSLKMPAHGPLRLPRVTIITPALNCVAAIDRALQSIDRQNYTNCEHIVIDGGSTDGTLIRIADYVAKAPQARKCVGGKDTGIYDAINKGIAAASGEIIGILNSDDWYEADAIATAVKVMMEGPCDIACGSVRTLVLDKRGDYIPTTWHAHPERLNKGMTVPHPGVFVRRSVYRRLGPFRTDLRIAADFEFLLRARRAGVAMIAFPQVVCNFSPGGQSSTRLWCTALEVFRVMIKYTGGFAAASALGRRVFELTALRAVLFAIRDKRYRVRR